MQDDKLETVSYDFNPQAKLIDEGLDKTQKLMSTLLEEIKKLIHQAKNGDCWWPLKEEQ